MEGAKEDFLRCFGDDYGYPNALKNIDEMRSTEFKRLEGLVYLDHAGATLYSEAQLEAIFRDLSTKVYGNPHSQSDSSQTTYNIISEARQQTDFFATLVRALNSSVYLIQIFFSNLEDGHVYWDDANVIRGKPTGAVRISFGYMSTFEDAESLGGCNRCQMINIDQEAEMFKNQRSL